jgi:GNAT superfamily N-acetyltransferase
MWLVPGTPGTLPCVDLLVRPAVRDDLAAMVAAKHDAGLAAWGHILPPPVVEGLPFPERWAEAVEAADPRVRVLVVEADSRVVGFAVTRPSGDAGADSTIGELDGFYVDPGSWGRGAGRRLLEAAVDALREADFHDATLWTAEENHRPRRIYQAAGWRTDGTERRRALGGVEFVELRYRIALARAS